MTKNYDGVCPNCKAGILMVNTSWAECVSPYCRYPHPCMGIWTADYDSGLLGVIK